MVHLLVGQKPKITTDALVLGESLKESGTRARMVACVDSSTVEVPMSVHLERVWEVMPVERLDVPQGLVEAGTRVHYAASSSGRRRRFFC